ncbi:MAG: MAPEG family protein [Halioglobus sp.]
MALVALVTLLLLLQYITFMMLTGKARGASELVAPACVGDLDFEKAYRVQMNTLEQLIVTLPAMWVCAHFFMPVVAAALGLAFFVGRILFRNAYVTDPTKRGPGMIVGFLANVGLILTAGWGVILQL